MWLAMVFRYADILLGGKVCYTDGAVTSPGRLGKIMGRCACGRILETIARNEISIIKKKKKGKWFFDLIPVCDVSYG